VILQAAGMVWSGALHWSWQTVKVLTGAFLCRGLGADKPTGRL